MEGEVTSLTWSFLETVLEPLCTKLLENSVPQRQPAFLQTWVLAILKQEWKNGSLRSSFHGEATRVLK